MSRLATAREELIAVAVGDLAVVLDRLEALTPLVNQARSGLVDAARELGAKVEPFKHAMHQVAADEQYAALHYMREHVGNTISCYREGEIYALKTAGRQVLEEEVGKSLKKLIASLQDLVFEAKRKEVLRTHVITALASSAITSGLLYLLQKWH
jgi:hypothetical protein